MSIRERAAELSSELVQLRRELHRIPEIGLHLPRTQETVLAALAPLGLEVTTGRGLSSVVAIVRGTRPGPVVLLRADMDALPITEDSGEEFSSQHPGAMHACGHDLHTAALVGAARLLADSRSELAGDVVLMFQPGEEGYDGAGAMIAEGVLEAAGRRVDAAYGLHVWSMMLPAGEVASRSGPLMAGAASLYVRVIGRGGHGSQPQTALDPVPVLGEILTGLQSMMTRRISPFEPAVLTVGVIRAGTIRNVIPDDAHLEATVRTFSATVMAEIGEYATRLCEGIAAAHGLSADVRFEPDFPPTINDATEYELAAGTARDLFGDKRYRALPQPVTASEDFSRILEHVPGAFVFLGADRTGDPTTAAANHSAQAGFDDAVVADGAALLAELAIRRTALRPTP
jgi:amidohydrolase